MVALKRRNLAEETSTDRVDAKNLLTREWVIGKLMANVERAMQASPVLDKWGEPTGAYRYEGSIANKALELLGKEIGMFKDTKPPEEVASSQTSRILQMLEGMSEVERVRRVATMLRDAEREGHITLFRRDPSGTADSPRDQTP